MNGCTDATVHSNMFLRIIIELLLFPLRFIELLITWLPGPIGDKIRYIYWKCRLKHLGKGTRIDVGVHFESPHCISIGAYCWIDRSVIIIAGYNESERKIHFKKNSSFKHHQGEVFIGDYVHLAPQVLLMGIGGIHLGNYSGVASGAKMYSLSHHYRNLNDASDKRQYWFSNMTEDANQALICSPVYVADYCAIGIGATLLPGACIEKGTWIACNVVVNGHIGSQQIISSQQPPKDISHLELP